MKLILLILGFLFFCQHNSTGGGFLVLKQIIHILRQQGFYRRFKNRGRSLNQSDRRERGFNRPRFLNHKTRVVFKIFSNTNILSEILINSEIIRGASVEGRITIQKMPRLPWVLW
jgi:hypothetical protein